MNVVLIEALQKKIALSTKWFVSKFFFKFIWIYDSMIKFWHVSVYFIRKKNSTKRLEEKCLIKKMLCKQKLIFINFRIPNCTGKMLEKTKWTTNNKIIKFLLYQIHKIYKCAMCIYIHELCCYFITWK